MTSTAQRLVLVVEDDETLQAVLQYNLAKEGYQVMAATDGESALEMARRSPPSLVLLDLMLPKLDGLEVCRLLRRETSVPILILTARDGEMDKVSGLDTGADDYITKPFSVKELMARVRALVRRSEMATEAPSSSLSVGDLFLDLQARTARLSDRSLELKPKEYDLLAFLAAHPGRAYTRNELLDQVWGYNYVGDTRTVDVHIRWLREKVEREPGAPRRIITVRGTGYRFEG
jgi:DNA-binding response OmpR family regulator